VAASTAQDSETACKQYDAEQTTQQESCPVSGLACCGHTGGCHYDYLPHHALCRAINIYGRRKHCLTVGRFSGVLPYYGICNTCPAVMAVEERPFAAMSASTVVPKLRAI